MRLLPMCSRIALWLVIAALGVGSMITACGHKGELYLPGPDEQRDPKRSP